MRFDKIILMGTGKIAVDCISYLSEHVEIEKLLVVESADSFFSILERACNKRTLSYIKITDKGQMEQYLLDYIQGIRSLIISVNNMYIFSAKLINTGGNDLEIINLHYGLLPYYRGMNIPTWVIFNGEKQTGITWHYVTPRIDCGNVIAQEVIDINENTIAFDIVKKGIELGVRTFKDFIGDFMARKIEVKQITYDDNDIVYRSTEIPMDGILTVNCSMEQTIRLLHCFDYKGIEMMPVLKLYYLNDYYKIKKYEIGDEYEADVEECYIEKENVFIRKADGKKIILYLERI